jgi:hypothetical protein
MRFNILLKHPRDPARQSQIPIAGQLLLPSLTSYPRLRESPRAASICSPCGALLARVSGIDSMRCVQLDCGRPGENRFSITTRSNPIPVSMQKLGSGVVVRSTAVYEPEKSP